MRFSFASLISLASCAVGPEPAEPTQPDVPDAGVSADASPVQTPNMLVLASRFARSCTRDDECAAIYEGNACAPVRCANAAIRRDALPAYRAQLGAYWSCQEPSTASCPLAIGDAAICVAGTCTRPGL